MALNEPIDRRALISGRLADPDAIVTPPGTEIASVLVQARPDRLTEVEARIAALDGCEIHGRDPVGKLVVVIEASKAGAIGSWQRKRAMFHEPLNPVSFDCNTPLGLKLRISPVVPSVP